VVLKTEKDKALNKQVHNRDIDKIDELVAIYVGDCKLKRRKAQGKILEFFDAYLEKYTNIFSSTQIDLYNYDTRLFLSLFLNGRERTLENFAKQRLYIIKTLSSFERQDLKAELTLVFLTVLDKYRIYEGVNALNPLTKIFRWRVKDWYNRVVKDALFHTKKTNLYVNGEEVDGHTWISKMVSVDVDFDEILRRMDLKWVQQPSQAAYLPLTKYERYLLLLLYGQSLPISKIAEKFHRDKDTIKRHLTSVLNKLENIYLNGQRS